MEPILVTASKTEALTLDEVKTHLRIDFSDDDTFLNDCIVAAREYGEDLTGWAFAEQTRLTVCDTFPRDKNYIELRQYPLVSVSSLKVKDYQGKETTLTQGTDYLVDTYSRFGRVVLPYGESWPDTQLYPVNPIQITFVCGAADKIPEMYKRAMLLHIGLMYGHRDEAIPEEAIGTVNAIYSDKNRLRRW